MSLFGSLMGDFDDDNFMGNHMNAMNMQMRSMNRLMNMNSLMPDPFNMLSPFGGDGGFGNHALMERHAQPMGLFGFPGIPNMNRLLSADLGANGGASFSSSSVISMSSGPDGRPQIYQSTSSTKLGPGGVRETRKTVQDSTTGLKKMAIGHHIGDRAHIIEKEQNLRSGENEERQEFINLEEEEAESFDQEFTTKVNMHATPEMITSGSHRSRHSRQIMPALPAPPQNRSSQSTVEKSKNRSTTKHPSKNEKQQHVNNATSNANATISNSPPPVPRRIYRNTAGAVSSPMATPRRPLRTPLSSPLALTSANPSNAATPTTSVHPHPYNTSAARRNYRSKHSKQHKTPHDDEQKQQQQLSPKDPNSDLNTIELN